MDERTMHNKWVRGGMRIRVHGRIQTMRGRPSLEITIYKIIDKYNIIYLIYVRYIRCCSAADRPCRSCTMRRSYASERERERQRGAAITRTMYRMLQHNILYGEAQCALEIMNNAAIILCTMHIRCCGPPPAALPPAPPARPCWKSFCSSPTREERKHTYVYLCVYT